jgi:hypothetical protein
MFILRVFKLHHNVHGFKLLFDKNLTRTVAWYLRLQQQTKWVASPLILFGTMNHLLTGYSGNNKIIVSQSTIYCPRSLETIYFHKRTLQTRRQYIYNSCSTSEPEFIPSFSDFRVAWFLVVCVLLGRSLFVLFYFFFWNHDSGNSQFSRCYLMIT